MSGLSLKRTIFHQSMTDYDFPCNCDKKKRQIFHRAISQKWPSNITQDSKAFAGSDPEVFIEFKGAPPPMPPPTPPEIRPEIWGMI